MHIVNHFVQVSISYCIIVWVANVGGSSEISWIRPSTNNVPNYAQIRISSPFHIADLLSDLYIADL